jgi:hypothetical protein
MNDADKLRLMLGDPTQPDAPLPAPTYKLSYSGPVQAGTRAQDKGQAEQDARVAINALNSTGPTGPSGVMPVSLSLDEQRAKLKSLIGNETDPAKIPPAQQQVPPPPPPAGTGNPLLDFGQAAIRGLAKGTASFLGLPADLGEKYGPPALPPDIKSILPGSPADVLGAWPDTQSWRNAIKTATNGWSEGTPPGRWQGDVQAGFEALPSPGMTGPLRMIGGALGNELANSGTTDSPGMNRVLGNLAPVVLPIAGEVIHGISHWTGLLHAFRALDTLIKNPSAILSNLSLPAVSAFQQNQANQPLQNPQTASGLINMGQSTP